MPIFARRGASSGLCWKGPAPSLSVGSQRGAGEFAAAVTTYATPIAAAKARQAIIRGIAGQHTPTSERFVQATFDVSATDGVLEGTGLVPFPFAPSQANCAKEPNSKCASNPRRTGYDLQADRSGVETERELRWLGRLLVPGIFDGEHIFHIGPLDHARTRFTQAERFSGILVGLLRSRLDKTELGFEQMNAALKARAERR